MNIPLTTILVFSLLKTIGTILVFRKPIMEQVSLYFKLRVEDKLFAKEKRGFNYYIRGEYSKAIPVYESILAIREDSPEEKCVDRASILASLGKIYTELKEFGKAEKMYKQALTMAKKRIEENKAFIETIQQGLSQSIELKKSLNKRLL